MRVMKTEIPIWILDIRISGVPIADLRTKTILCPRNRSRPFTIPVRPAIACLLRAYFTDSRLRGRQLRTRGIITYAAVPLAASNFIVDRTRAATRSSSRTPDTGIARRAPIRDWSVSSAMRGLRIRPIWRRVTGCLIHTLPPRPLSCRCAVCNAVWELPCCP